MSRIGKKPVIIPEGVTATVKNGEIVVTGPKGFLSLTIPSKIKIEEKDGTICVLPKNEFDESRDYQGTIRQLIANMVVGVKDGWSKSLEVVGTGFRAVLEGEKLVLSLGFSHQVELVPPPGITFKITERQITIFGIDKTQVGRLAARIKAIKPPDPYKGKGIRFVGEYIKLKPGKQVKVGVAGAAAPTQKG